MSIMGTVLLMLIIGLPSYLLVITVLDARDRRRRDRLSSPPRKPNAIALRLGAIIGRFVGGST